MHICQFLTTYDSECIARIDPFPSPPPPPLNHDLKVYDSASVVVGNPFNVGAVCVCVCWQLESESAVQKKCVELNALVSKRQSDLLQIHAPNMKADDK